MLDNITPIILSYNEAPNIERTLSSLKWAARIVVVDSFSNDNTEQLCKKFANVDFIQREFDQHAKQWNFAIDQAITTDWVLALDADHVLSDALINELAELKPDNTTTAFWLSFIYKINGQALRGSLYPPLLSLFKHQHAHYEQDGHTQRLHVSGNTRQLRQAAYHDDRKSHHRWRQSQRQYAQQELAKLKQCTWSELSWPERARLLGFAPLLSVAYTLFYRGLILDGKVGLIYSWQRFMAELELQKARIADKLKSL